MTSTPGGGGEQGSSARARLQLLGAALLFSTGGAAVKATALSAWQVAGFRSGVACAAVLLLLPAARRGWSWHVLPVGAAYAGTMILFVAANKLTTAANAIFLSSTAPLYVLLLGPLLLREPVRRSDLGFMAVVAGGMMLFFVGTEPPVATAPDPRRGNVLALLGGVCWALTVTGMRWLGTRGGGAGAMLPTVAAGNAIAFLVCLAPALPVRGGSLADALVVGYLGVFQIGAAYVLLTAGLRHVRALEASVLLLLEPALNPVWAWLAHGERPGPWSLGGGAVIVGATLARTWLSTRSARPGPTTPLSKR